MFELPEDLIEMSKEEVEFIAHHGMQLVNNGVKITKEICQKLYKKLKSEEFNAGDHMQLMEDPGEKCFRLQATQGIQANSDVYLVDHFFSFRYCLPHFRYKELRNQLMKNETLRKRLRSMTKFFPDRKCLKNSLYRPKSVDPLLNPEFDGDESIIDPRNLNVDWENIETLSLCYTGVSEPDLVAEMLTKCPKLKALWLLGCPLNEGPAETLMFLYIEEKFSNIQIYNSKFTKHAKEWAIKLANWGLGSTIADSVPLGEMKGCDINGRNFYALKDDHSLFDAMKKVRSLSARDTTFNSFGEANRFIEMIRDMKELERLEMDYYLLDLFWKIKERIKGLNPGIRYINGYDLGYDEPKELDEEVDFIIEHMWKITKSYKVVVGENIDREPIFYVLDEVGSAVSHSVTPNFVSFPFIFFPENQNSPQSKTYNLMYPIASVEEGEFITADYNVGVVSEMKDILIGVWDEIPFEELVKRYEGYSAENRAREEAGRKLVSGYLAKSQKEAKVASLGAEQKTKIFSDYEVLKKHLSHPRLELVENVEEADVLFAIQNFKYYVENVGDK
jgi:tubulin--tyrosine ligase-like protein 12